MPKTYRFKSNTRGHSVGATATEKELKDAGYDIDFLKSNNAIEVATDDGKDEPTPGINPDAPMTDAANKATIERRIGDETLKRGEPLPVQQQQELAAKETAENRDPEPKKPYKGVHPTAETAPAAPAVTVGEPVPQSAVHGKRK